ncbi:MAG TPA: Lrp/AsnC family transcriptional regulator [Paracoccus sp.]|nr:Lrp/AsnC family transcriptional regulator [Paracoccus sp. (in: a-proteobacteria)]
MRPLALDDRDIAILSILTREGRISKADLARRVNLSPTPCWQRLNRMTEAGLIRGYRAEVALARLAQHVSVFVTIELDSHRAENFQTFERAVARIDEITGCWAVGGGYDYLLQVITRDVAAYQALMDALLERRAGVKRYFSYIVTKDVKAAPPPLAALLGGSS